VVHSLVSLYSDIEIAPRYIAGGLFSV